MTKKIKEISINKIKDPISGLSHLIGAVISIFGLVFLILNAKNTIDLVSVTIFGISLILLYTASAMYHLLNVSEKITVILRKIDHIMIYVLIAGTYTPICLKPLIGAWGWSIFGINWTLTILGIFLTLFWLNAPRWLTTGIYLLMGWMAIIAIYPIIVTFKAYNIFMSLIWLLAGGVWYTIGAIIYGFKWPKLKNKYFSFHEIFHIFIILGSLFHYYFIFRYILPM